VPTRASETTGVPTTLGAVVVVVVVVVVVGGNGAGVDLAAFPFSLTTAEPDALILPLTVSSENVNRFALFVVFAGNFATRLNFAAHFTLASNPLTFGLTDHAHVFADLTVARIVTDPPDAMRVDLLALTVTVFGAFAAAAAEPTNGIAESAPRSTAAAMVREALFMSRTSSGDREGVCGRSGATTDRYLSGPRASS
jgi:hypothetical protein